MISSSFCPTHSFLGCRYRKLCWKMEQKKNFAQKILKLLNINCELANFPWNAKGKGRNHNLWRIHGVRRTIFKVDPNALHKPPMPWHPVRSHSRYKTTKENFSSNSLFTSLRLHFFHSFFHFEHEDNFIGLSIIFLFCILLCEKVEIAELKR